MTQCKDHLNIIYNSKGEMCAHYGQKLSRVCERLRNGWPLEKALTTPAGHGSSVPVTGLNGEHFQTKAKAAEHYNIPASRLRTMTLREAVKVPYKNRKDGCEDHLRKHYSSIKEMCSAYGVNLNFYYKKKKEGWTLAEILTYSSCEDHTGKKYKKRTDMAKAYGKTYKVIKGRLDLGWTLKQALIIPYPSPLPKIDNMHILFTIDDTPFYDCRCPICNQQFAFSSFDLREHYISHL